MNICIDIGNTNAKAAIFDEDKLKELQPNLTDRGIVKFLQKHNAEHVLISSVRRGIGRIIQSASRNSNVIQFNHQTPLPFVNCYNTPETLGLDRIASIAGAAYLYPKKHCLVVDIGTCITYDIIENSGNYLGGGISPGVEMKLKSLHKFTSKLPLVSSQGSVNLIGKTTKECIQSGVIMGTVSEIEGIIDLYEQFFEGLTIIFCGGGAKFFESKIKGHIFAIQNLVLIGLNQVLRFNLNE